MANLNHLLTHNSSIEDILENFESRTSNGHLKYSRLILTLVGSFGSISSKVSIILKRTPYSKTGTGFLTFSDFKSHIASSRGFFQYKDEPYTTMNSYIKQYQEYYSSCIHNKQKPEKTIYEFSDTYYLAARSIKDKYHNKYGDCKLYYIYGIEISPYKFTF